MGLFYSVEDVSRVVYETLARHEGSTLCPSKNPSPVPNRLLPARCRLGGGRTRLGRTVIIVVSG